MAEQHRKVSHRIEEDRLRAKIIELREANGLSQRQLSAKLGLHPMTVGKIERGERSVTVVELIDLAATFGIDPSELVSAAKG